MYRSLRFVYMRLFTSILMVSLALVGCRSPSASSGQQPNLAMPDCRRLGPTATGAGLEGVLAAVAQAQVNDLRCGPPSDTVRICRALFLTAVIDPMHYLGDPSTWERVHDAMRWSLDDAISVAPPELTPALMQVRALPSAREDEADVVLALAARAEPTVIDPLDSYWTNRCQ